MGEVKHYVYWLHDGTCSVPENDGYVGITNNPAGRLRAHKYFNKLNPEFVMTILFKGTREKCLESEQCDQVRWSWQVGFLSDCLLGMAQWAENLLY